MRALVLLLTAWAISAFSPSSPQVAAGQNTHVSGALPDAVQWEVVTCADPSRKGRLLTVGLIDSGVTPERFLTDGVAYLTDDGGRTWRLSFDLRDKAGGTIDPDCVFGPDGSAYVSMMYRAPEASDEELALYRSADGGRTWLPPVIAPKSAGIDRPYIAIDDTAGKYEGRIYMSGHLIAEPAQPGAARPPRSLVLFRSLDGGRSIEPPARLAMPDVSYFTAPGGVAVLSDGTVVSLFYQTKAWCTGTDGRRADCSPASPRFIKSYVSSDGGQSLSVPVTVATTAMQPGTIALAVDRGTGPFKDRLYALWDDIAEGRTRVLLARSDDKGKSWSAPLTVSDAVRWSPPDMGPDIFLPALAVSRTGVVGVSWYDERGNPGREHVLQLGYELRFAASVDGGETFLPSVRVTAPNVAEARRKGEWLSAVVTPPSATWDTTSLSVSLKPAFLGHTAGLAADPAGVFHAVWIDARTGVGQIWSAPVTVEGTAQINGSAELADLVDISATATIDVARVWYDRARHRVSAEVRVRNTGREPIAGPVYVRLLTLSAATGRAVAQSDNGIGGAGAVWDFTRELPGGRLLPGQASAFRTFEFAISDVRRGAPELTGPVRGFIHFNARVLSARPSGAARAPAIPHRDR